MPLGLGLGALLGGIGSGVLGGIGSIFGQSMQNDNTIKLQNMQNKFNKEMWDLNNEYNTPINQMDRLLKAGLSPGAATQAITGAGNSTGPITASQMQSAPLDAGLGQILGGIPNTINSLMNLKADTRLKNAEADRNEKTLTYDIENLKSTIRKQNAELGLTKEQIKYQRIINKYAAGKEEATIRQIQESYRKTVQETANLKQDEKRLVWENFYRTEFNIDPNSNIMNQIVTATLKGDIEPVWNAFEKVSNFIFDKAKIGYEALKEKFNDWMKKDKQAQVYNGFKTTNEQINNKVKNPYMRAATKWISLHYYLKHLINRK